MKKTSQKSDPKDSWHERLAQILPHRPFPGGFHVRMHTRVDKHADPQKRLDYWKIGSGIADAKIRPFQKLLTKIISKGVRRDRRLNLFVFYPLSFDQFFHDMCARFKTSSKCESKYIFIFIQDDAPRHAQSLRRRSRTETSLQPRMTNRRIAQS